MLATRARGGLSRQKLSRELCKLTGPRPLPPHFGEIDIGAPFDAAVFFTVMRCSGANPMAARGPDGRIFSSFDVREKTHLQQKRYTSAIAWANAKDPHEIERQSHIRSMLKDRDHTFLGSPSISLTAALPRLNPLAVGYVVNGQSQDHL